jgi:hypothetical protein
LCARKRCSPFSPQGRALCAFAGAVTALFTALLFPLLFFLQLEIILETMRFCQPLFRANPTKQPFRFARFTVRLHAVVKIAVSLCEFFDNLTKNKNFRFLPCILPPSLV